MRSSRSSIRRVRSPDRSRTADADSSPSASSPARWSRRDRSSAHSDRRAGVSSSSSNQGPSVGQRQPRDNDALDHFVNEILTTRQIAGKAPVPLVVLPANFHGGRPHGS